jgi:transcriptional regulator with XRE-family HTH domain
MTGLIRATRTQMGVSMQDLADRLGIGVQAVSTLELNDERGAIKVETRNRALLALGKREINVLVDAQPSVNLDAVEAEARALVERTAWSMALSGKSLTDDAVERLVKKFVDKRVTA